LTILLLAVAIAFEVLATSALKLTDGFTRLGPSLVTILGYGLAFYFLSLTLRTLPVGVVYAVWSGAGIVVVALIGWLVFRQPLDAWGIFGIALILAGVLVLNVLSRSMAH
jgi:small multidrug resistance pump